MTYVSASFDQPPRYPLLTFFHQLHLLYKNHARLFLKIATPPVVFGALAILATSRQAAAMLATLPRGPELRFHLREVSAASAVRISGFLVSWIVNVFGFSAVAVAVERLAKGESPSAEECYAPAREHAGRIVTLSLILLSFVLLTILAAGFVGSVSYRIFNSVTNPFLYLVLIAGFTVAATYALAIPICTLENLPIRAALKRSDFLTGASFGQLFLLIGESFLSGYLAALIPAWIAQIIEKRIGWSSWANWIVWAFTTYGVAMADLVLLIGLSVLYWELSAATQKSQDVSVEPA